MNSECKILSHATQCSCPPGFTGNPDVECVRVPVSCNQPGDCSPGNTCRDSMCLPECQSDNQCAFNEKCMRGNCILTCRVDNDCFLGHICLHNTCLFGCHGDEDCSASESCRNNRCVNPCSESPCGPNAMCSVTNQRATCSCANGFVPNPTAKIACVRTPALPCTENRVCPFGTTCSENACRPVCSKDSGCLSNERCDVRNGVCKPLCRKDNDCPTGEYCEDLMCIAGCRSDSGCPSDRSCLNNKCVDICKSPTACGTNAECSCINHKKVCSCPYGLVGDPLSGCRLPATLCVNNNDCSAGQTCFGGLCQSICSKDNDCLSDERCLDNICKTICNTDAKCGGDQICENRVCQIGCRSDTICPDNQACLNNKCQDPCDSPNSCGECAECRVINHGVQCSCPSGFLGNPLTSCVQPAIKCNGLCECDSSGYCTKTCGSNLDCACSETCIQGKCRAKCSASSSCARGHLCQNGICLPGCRTSSDCANDKSCISGECKDPCLDAPCGVNALCRVSDHRTICLCPDGYQGEPTRQCTPYECLNDNDCEQGKYCGEDKACRNPCLEFGTCGINAQCHVVNRRAQCTCPSGLAGNPLIECKQEGHKECLRNPCGANTRCRDVQDGSFECSCINGCIGDPYRGCVCEGSLINLCKTKQCGANAECRVVNKVPQCYCPQGYPAGNPDVECTVERTVLDCRTEGCGNGAECLRDGVVFACRCEQGFTGNPDEGCEKGKCFLNFSYNYQQ